MFSQFEQLVAIRYLKRAQGRDEGRRFVRFITYIAIGGVAVGVAALLLGLSIVRGFSSEITSKIEGFGAHVQVMSFHDEPLQDVQETLLRIEENSDVIDAAPIIEEFALLRRSAVNIDGVSVRGVASPPAYLAEHLIAGDFSFVPDSAGLTGIVIGSQLARLMSLNVGDRVVIFSMNNGALEQSTNVIPHAGQFHVNGIYETSFANFDELYVFTSLEAARSLFKYGEDEVTRVDVQLTDMNKAAGVAAEIEEAFGFPYLARTIFQVFRQYFAWVNLQEGIIPLVIGVIIFVAAVNIIGTLLMIMLEKTPEIGILGSMGASARSIKRVFLWLGLLIGAVGLVIGELLALVLALLQMRYSIIPLPEEAYYMKVAPVLLNPMDFIVVGLIALVLCGLASYIPARRAARIIPIRAIRFR